MGIKESVESELARQAALKAAEATRVANQNLLFQQQIQQQNMESSRQAALAEATAQRRRKQALDRVTELMNAMGVREQLTDIRDNIWNGLGEIDLQPELTNTEQSTTTGVMMLRVPYKHAVVETVEHHLATGWESDGGDGYTATGYRDIVEKRTKKNLYDFASIRVGIGLDTRERESVMVNASASAFSLLLRSLPDNRMSRTYEQKPLWAADRSANSQLIFQEGRKSSEILEGLLVNVLTTNPIDVANLSPKPWYRRFF